MPVKEAEIRAAETGDLDAVAEIYSHYVLRSLSTFEETPPTVDYWRQRLDDLAERGLPFLVADVGGEVVGYAYAGPWRPRPAYRYTVEDSIYLARGWSGRGLGRALLEALLAGCERAGARQMIAVIADTGDDASVRLHSAFGFTHAGRLVGVGQKHGRSVDTVLMQRALATNGV